RGSGQTVAHEVTEWDPTQRGGALSIDGGAAILSADAGSTGGGTLLYTSDPVAAGQLFDRVGLHWLTIAGAQDSVALQLRTSADGTAWGDWVDVANDFDMEDHATGERFGPPQTTVDGARYAQYRVWLLGADPGALVRV